MKSVGLITEYNPFHNGHLHHLRESLKTTGAQVSVAVMSGHFLQRGEPALVDKWVRTEMALRAGVDLVIELPVPFACNSAPHFALGAVKCLDALGAVDALCFGSETGELPSLQRCADLMIRREDEIAGQTADLLREGINYPEARERVAAGIFDDPSDARVMASPNNILGIEYLTALRRAGSSIRPRTILRRGAGYHDRNAVGNIASATGIRRMLLEGEEIAPFIPPDPFVPLRQALDRSRHSDPDLLLRLVLSEIFRGPEDLRDLYLVEDGMENRLLKAGDTAVDFEELGDMVKARHVTRTRIQRMLCHVLLGTKRDDMEAFLETGPLYLHLLGVSREGRNFLSACRKHLSLPLISNYSRVYAEIRKFYGWGSARCGLAERMLDYELRATRLYTLLMKRWESGSRNRDFFEEVVRV